MTEIQTIYADWRRPDADWFEWLIRSTRAKPKLPELDHVETMTSNGKLSENLEAERIRDLEWRLKRLENFIGKSENSEKKRSEQNNDAVKRRSIRLFSGFRIDSAVERESSSTCE